MPKHPPITDAEVAMFQHLVDKGMSAVEIAEHTGRSVKAVLRRVKPRKAAPRITPFDHTKHLEAYRAGQAAKVKDDTSHDRHIAHIARANNGMGFPVLKFGGQV